MTESEIRTEKHITARESLTDDQRPVFDKMVTHYRYAGIVHHRTPFISYLVLAELVKLGWRCPEADADVGHPAK
jgi:hypothetical protein